MFLGETVRDIYNELKLKHGAMTAQDEGLTFTIFNDGSKRIFAMRDDGRIMKMPDILKKAAEMRMKVVGFDGTGAILAARK